MYNYKFLQMNPSSLPKFKGNDKLSFDRHRSFPLQTKDSCPEGMVPIQRNRINNHTDLKSISKLHLGSIRISTSGRHVSILNYITTIVLDYAKEFVINTMNTKGCIKYGNVYHVMKKK